MEEENKKFGHVNAVGGEQSSCVTGEEDENKKKHSAVTVFEFFFLSPFFARFPGARYYVV